eukprot:scpid47318/ scgid5941/ 
MVGHILYILPRVSPLCAHTALCKCTVSSLLTAHSTQQYSLLNEATLHGLHCTVYTARSTLHGLHSGDTCTGQVHIVYTPEILGKSTTSTLSDTAGKSAQCGMAASRSRLVRNDKRA